MKRILFVGLMLALSGAALAQAYDCNFGEVKQCARDTSGQLVCWCVRR